MARGGAMTFTVSIDDDAVLAGLRAQRRAINQDVKKTTLIAGEKTVLPTTKRLAPSIIRGPLTVRSTTRGAYITTTARGRWRKVTGLLNFGGTVKATIRPVNAKALKIGDRYVARVTGPRTYRAKEFMQRSVQANLGRFSQSVEEQMTALFQSRITYARTFG